MKTLVIATLFALVGGCTGQIAAGSSDEASSGDEETGGVGGRGGGNPAGGAGGSGGLGGAGGAARAVGSTPVRRLTRGEWLTTVRAAFPGLSVTVAASDLPQDERIAGFSAQSHDLLDDAKIGQYLEAAAKVADAVVAQPDGLLGGCKRAERGDATCVREGLAGVLPRLWRRPVEAAEVAALSTDVFEPLARAHDFAVALGAVVRRVLLSTSFLFKLEQGTPVNGLGRDVYRLSPHELANRLSYFVWGSPPDDELRVSAANGTLAEAKVLDAQADRLLDDPRANAVVRRFHVEWLHLDALAARQRSTDKYPAWSEALRASMLEETGRFVESLAARDSGPWTDLFVAHHSFVDGRLAKLYGATAPATGFAKVSLPPERAGLLTQAAFLTAHSHAEDTQMIHRGLIVRERILCQPMPLPMDVNTSEMVDRLTAPQCASCHERIEAIGVGFERFDGIGASRASAMSVRGKLVGLEAGDRTFDSVAELGPMLAEQTETATCLARQWLRFALGRDDEADGDEGDASTIERLKAALGTSGTVRGLIKALVTSDAFLHRREAASTEVCR